jgi:GIY-YIG catalytic domain
MDCNDLLAPARLFSRDEVLSRPSPVPNAPGVYAWYFREIPAGVPTANCVQHDGATLLYAGISPSAPPANGKRPSSQSLWHRIRYHYRGNAEGSTLRLTLGCLLADELGIQLRRVGSGKRMTFGPGEAVLSEWMGRNALVAFHVCERPWQLEAELLRTVSLPLNLDQNRNHAFHSTLTQMRGAAKERSRNLAVLA